MKRPISATIALSLLASKADIAQRDCPNDQGQNGVRRNNGVRFDAEGFNDLGPGGLDW